MQNLSGHTIKGYELRDCLGIGGFGAVYKASQANVGREVAIKIILPGLANQPDFIRRFETEAQVIARLEHQSIVPLYDYWREPDGAYLVMRWLRGGSLADLLKQGTLDLETTARILDQVSAALVFAHRSNIIHRDIKPGNILLDEDSNAYLADFGIAKDLKQSDSGTQMDAIVGSLDYISPEQARSEPVTPRTDIYSLGVVLYEMLTGQHPFPGISSIERLYKHINDPLPDITTLDDAICDAVNQVVQTATAKNPALRYEDAAQMAMAFKEAAGLNRTSSSTIVELLTRREQEVVSLLVTGATNKDIAQKLFITVPTVKWYLNEIFRKLRVRSRVQAIVRARELNLIVSAADSSDETAPSVMLDTLPEPENPYKGLKAFQSADERDFFGREEFVQKLLKRLTPAQTLTKTDNTFRFLAVVGPSGGGKSSVVRAGLIPALLRGGLPGSERWFVVEMLPGAHPFDELEVALLKIAPNQAQLRDQLLRDERGLIRAAQLLLPQDDSELVIVIDQFEEVFTLVSDETQRQRFLALLVAAVTDPRSRIRVVITLRADFYDRPLNYPEFGELLRSHIETLLPLSAKGLEKAILEPARRVGVKFEDGLATTIISDVNYQAGALPLLQYALTELFEQREGRLLTHAAYLKIGRAVGALAKRAEDIYQELTPEAQTAAQQVFLRLVTPGDGTEDTRRRVARSELRYAVPTPNPEQPSPGAASLHREGNYQEDLVEEIIDTYAEYRLLALDNDPATRTPTVEVAHEALLREWERLRAWLNESRADIRLQRQLAAQAEEWEKSKRDKSYLLTGSRLEQFEKWTADTTFSLTPQERDFLAKSIAQRDLELKTEQERQAREQQLERRSRNFLRGLVAVLVLAMFGTILLSAFALSAQRSAETERDFSRELAIVNGVQLALFNNNGDQARALAFYINRNPDPSAQAQRALGDAMYSIGTIRVISSSRDIGNDPSSNVGNVSGVVFSPDSASVFAGEANQITQWDIATGMVRYIYEGHNDRVLTLAVSPDGNYLLSGDYGGVLILRTLADDAIVKEISLDAGQITAFTFDPSSTQVMVGTDDGTLLLLNMPDLKISHRFVGHTDAIGGVAISPNGRLALSGSYDATLRLWDFQTKELLYVFDETNGGHNMAVTAVAFNADSTMALSGSYDITTTLWNLSSYISEHRFVEPAPINDVAFSPNGQVILSNSFEAPTLWDANSKAIIARLVGHSGMVYGAAFSPDGNYIATRGLDRAIRLWSTHNGAEINTFALRMPLPMTLDMSSDGQYLLIGSGGQDAFRDWSGEVIMIDAATGQEIRTFGEQQPGLNIYKVAFSPDDRYIVSSGFIWDQFDSTILTIWDTATGETVHRLEGHHTTVYAVAFSPDGKYLLTGSETNEAVLLLWNVQTGEMMRRYDNASNTPHGTIYAITYNLDGTRAYIGYGDGTLLELDISSGKILHEFGVNSEKHHGRITAIDMNSDAQTLLTASEDTTLILWDVESGDSVRVFSGQMSDVQDGMFSPDGHWVFSVGDHYVTQWDVSTGEAIRRFPHFAANSIEVSLDNETVYSSGYDFSVRTWRIDTQEQLMEWATTNRYIRELNCTERDLYHLEPLCEAEQSG